MERLTNKKTRGLLLAAALLLAGVATGFAQSMNTNQTQVAYLGGGCFWCMEAEFQRISGVKSVTSGFAGGHTEDPSYEDVCTGMTGHAEVTRIEFDPQKISYEKILKYFWDAHDPTTLNRQERTKGLSIARLFYTPATRKKRRRLNRKPKPKRTLKTLSLPRSFRLENSTKPRTIIRIIITTIARSPIATW